MTVGTAFSHIHDAGEREDDGEEGGERARERAVGHAD